jgi:hypothetical protein
MAKPVAAFEGGIHARTQVAVRADGRAFQRWQERGMRGYVWSRWTEMKEAFQEIPQSIEAGFSTLYRAGSYSNWENWRLPN